MALSEPAKLWVAALRSGEFNQGVNYLRPQDSWCCLGVACELFRRETGLGAWYGDDFVVEGHGGSLQSSDTTLPVRVMNWLGLCVGDGTYGGSLFNRSLAQANDSGRSFSDIADLIESEPPGLFVETT